MYAVVGAGALGYLTAHSIREQFIIIDRDVVEDGNQWYRKEDASKPKVDIISRKLKNAQGIFMDINPASISVLDRADVVIDCTDNMYTRYILNDYCNKTRKRFIFSGIDNTGYSVMHFFRSPCLRCIMPKSSDSFFCTGNIPESILKRAVKAQFSCPESYMIQGNRKFKINKNPECKCCAKHNYEYLKSCSLMVSRSCDSTYIIPRSSAHLAFKNKKTLMHNGISIIIFSNKAAIIKTADAEKSLKIYRKKW